MTRKKTKNLEPDVMGAGEDDFDLDLMGEGPADTTAQDRLAAEVLGVFRPNEDFDRKRSATNMELVGILAQYLSDHPQQRFGQALRNLDLATEDCALVEPQVQLKRAKAALKRK